MTTTEKTLKKHIIYEGKILTLRRDEALLPNGQTCFREMVEHPGGVAVCLELDGKIAFVRQFRYPYGTEVLELPAGKLDKGAESPAHCGSRELLEETGWYCPPEQLRALGEIYPSPGGKENYWDNVPLDVYNREFYIEPRPCQEGDVIEIDTLTELQELDPVYKFK